MKYLPLIALALISQASFAASQEYNCECVDTGLECDGIEKMSLVLDSEEISLQVTDRDGDFPQTYTGQIDTRYRPRTRVNSIRYLTGNPTYPSLTVEKDMLEGAETGSVRMPEFGSHDSFVHEWVYECEIAR